MTETRFPRRSRDRGSATTRGTWFGCGQHRHVTATAIRRRDRARAGFFLRAKVTSNGVPAVVTELFWGSHHRSNCAPRSRRARHEDRAVRAAARGDVFVFILVATGSRAAVRTRTPAARFMNS